MRSGGGGGGVIRFGVMARKRQTHADVVAARYLVAAAADRIEQEAKAIALEQTVEVPESLVTDAAIRERVVGRIASIEPTDPAEDGRTRFAVTLHYNADLANGQLPQLLNLVYGNISIKNHIRLVDLALPGSLLGRFRGPNFGIAGVRDLLGVHGRPLLMTALKPRGSDVAALAAMAGAFARGGGDMVKDDHNLVDDSLAAFTARVTACHQAVEAANAVTGRNCLYLPNVCVRFDQLEEHLLAVVRAGIRGILISPMLVGLDAARWAAERFGLLIAAHPTAAGTFFHDRVHGITPAVLLGTLSRLAGADISVFPNAGGRFGFSVEECADIGQALAAPLGALKPALPAPAGGMQFDNVPAMARQYGRDAVFLVGGALLSRGPDLAASTAELLQAVNKHFDAKLTTPRRDLAGACELPGVGARQGKPALLEHLAFRDDFTWAGRPVSEYKADDALPFRDVARHELLGRFGERAAFDLRYFEIGPGGFSSCEKHAHTHAIIAARGRGVLLLGDKRYALRPLDIAHVPPLAAHQLRNEAADEPFGFFCIVDHDRDRPRPAV